MRLLLIEDDHLLTDAVAYVLNKSGYGVDVAHEGSTGLEMASKDIYEALIVDWMLPGMAGVEIIRQLRERGLATPIMMLTAKETIEDRVFGLDAGADDYLVKPFAMEEFLARVRALCRRKSVKLDEQVLTCGNIRFNPTNSEFQCGDETVRLTFKENLLLELLMANKNQVLPREVILDRVWGFDSVVEENNIEIYVYYLRKKLQTEACGIRIETVRGVGYRLREEPYV